MKTSEPTVGRARELGVLGEFLDLVEDDGEVLILTGQAGAGKSHLLRAAAQAATSRGMAVHATSGVRYEAELRFAGLNQLLRPLRHEFGHLSADQGALLDSAMGFCSGNSEDVDLVADAVRGLLNWLSKARPALLVVDDLHWLDSSSKAVITAIARSLAGMRVGLLAAVCPGLDEDHALTGFPACELQPLDDSAATDLLRVEFPTLGEPLLGRVLQEAQGNPLVLRELAMGFTNNVRQFSTRVPDVLPINARLRSAFGSQLATLPASTRGVLLLAALGQDGPGEAGDSGRLELEESELHCLSPAVNAALVEIDQRSRHIAFSHPLVRTTVVAQSTSAERRDAHRRLAERVSGRDGRLRHLARGAVDPDERLARELEQVAQRSVGLGNGSKAVEALRHSAELTPQRSERARRLTEAAYIGAELAGSPHHVGGLLAEARQADPGTADSLPAAVAEAFVLLNVDGNVDAAHGRLVAGLKAHAHRVEIVDPPLLNALYLLAEICAQGGRQGLWEPLDQELTRLGNKAPLLLVVFRDPLNPLHLADPARVGALGAAIAAMAGGTHPVSIGHTATAAHLSDGVSSIRDALWRVARTEGANSSHPPVVKTLAALAADSFSAGRWDESYSIASKGRRCSDLHGFTLASQGFQLDLALVAAARGRDDGVCDVTVAIGDWAATRGARLLELRCHQVRALRALGRGDFEEAYRHARVVCPAGRPSGSPPLARAMTLDLVEAAVKTNRRAAAADHVRSVQAAGTAALSPRLAMVVAASAGIAAEDDAAHHFEQALAVEGAERWPFELARVQLAYGERLRRMRAPAVSRSHLVAAQDGFTRLGAMAWAARATKELDATVKHRRRGEAFGPRSITPQEREVALLAASGLTNKSIAEQLFISHRTVGAHLRNLFPKLGITTRSSLRDALQAQSLIGV